MSSTATALVPVEQSQVAVAIDNETAGLLALLGTPEQVERFKRVVIQALAKNPELLECTPASVTLSVFEAAAQGLEPTGAAGGAHLVPFNVKVTEGGRERWEKRAQLIPDYRGVVRMVTRPDPRTGTPSEVVSIEARVVKEGDDFAYELGTNAFVRHVPTLAPDRSAKPTTHVYAVAHLRSGPPKPDVEDRAGIERIRTRGKSRANSPWSTDWDEMAKKTIVKRLSKLLPVTPEVRTILAREDETEDDTAAAAAHVVTSAPRTAQLAARLRPVADPEPVEDRADPDQGVVVELTDPPAATGAPEPLSSEAFLEFLRAWAGRHNADEAFATALARRLSGDLFPGTTKLDDEQRARLAVRMDEED